MVEWNISVGVDGLGSWCDSGSLTCGMMVCFGLVWLGWFGLVGWFGYGTTADRGTLASRRNTSGQLAFYPTMTRAHPSHHRSVTPPDGYVQWQSCRQYESGRAIGGGSRSTIQKRA